MKFLKTKDLPRAAFLVTRGFNCIGAVPAAGSYRDKLFVFQYDDSEEDSILAAEDDYLKKNDSVSAIEFYRAQKTLKHYINDIK